MALREGLLLAAAFNIDVSETDTDPTKAAMLRFYRTLKRSASPRQTCASCVTGRVRYARSAQAELS